MTIGGAFLGGGVELVPAGSCKLVLEIRTEDGQNLATTFSVVGGGQTYTATAGADGRAELTVPSGVTYTVTTSATGYDGLTAQTVVGDSATVQYVRFEAILPRVRKTGDTMSGNLTVNGVFSSIKGDIGNLSQVGGDATGGKWYRVASMSAVKDAYNDSHLMLGVWDNYNYSGYPVTRTGILNVHVRRATTSFAGNIRFILAGSEIDPNAYALVTYSDFSAELYAKQVNSYGKPSFTRLNPTGDTNKWVLHRTDIVSVDSLDSLGGTVTYANLPVIKSPTSSSDNGNTPATTSWVNTADSVLHKTGNETKNGVLTLTSPLVDPQNQSGYISTPISNASAIPYRKVASISMDDVGAWDTVSLIFDVEWGWNASEHHVCTFRASISTNGDKAIIRVLFSKIWSSGLAYSTVLNVDHWWLLHNAKTKEVQIWMKNEYDQLSLNYRVRMSGRRNVSFANWKLHTSYAGDGVASLPSTDDGWVIVNATDISNRMAFSTPTDATGQEIVTADWSLGKFLKKSGDTMSDTLTIANNLVPTTVLKLLGASVAEPQTYNRHAGYAFQDSRGFEIGSSFITLSPTGKVSLTLQTKSDKSGSNKTASVIIHNEIDGKGYATAPSTPSDATSDEIATADWVLGKVPKRTTFSTWAELNALLVNGKPGDMMCITLDYVGDSNINDFTASDVNIHAFGNFTVEELTVSSGKLTKLEAFGGGEIQYNNIRNRYFAMTGFGQMAVGDLIAWAFRVPYGGEKNLMLMMDNKVTSCTGFYVSL